MISYKEPELVEHLKELPPLLRVCFAASCATRLFPLYEHFSEQTGRGNHRSLSAVLARLWEDLISGVVAHERLRADTASCMELIPAEDEAPWEEGQAYAEDAAAALAYSLRAFESGDAQEAAWAARRCYESLDHFATHKLGLDDEGTILAHPVIQSELRQQRDDLALLRGVRAEPQRWPEIMAAFRQRATLQGRQLLASLSS